MSVSPTVDNVPIYTKGLQSDLNTTPIEDGKIRFTTDTGRLYLDIGSNNRILISETVDLYTEQEIKAILAPLPKIYVASDTHRAFVYSVSTLSWIDLAAIKLSEATSANADKVLWMSDTSDEQPVYDAGLKYNPSTDLLIAPNIKATTTMHVGNMRIQNTLNPDNTSHTVLIDFI